MHVNQKSHNLKMQIGILPYFVLFHAHIQSDRGSSEDTPIISSIIADSFVSRMDVSVIQVDVDPTLLAGMECSYYGCYHVDRFEHGLPYHFPFTAATKCTFTSESQP